MRIFLSIFCLLRYNIMSEIIAATSIQNLKRMKGQSTSKEMSTKSTSKGELLRARNLTRYLNQVIASNKDKIQFLSNENIIECNASKVDDYLLCGHDL